MDITAQTSVLETGLGAVSAPIAQGAHAPPFRGKRSLDLAIGLALLPLILVILGPLMVAVWLTSPGPALYRQVRTGQRGQVFTIYKLRSLRADPGAPDFRQVQRGDGRITPVGRWLRRTSLDELPQIFNVLKGDMSLVGPRPHALDHDARFRPLIAGYDRRFAVRPGITGLAQLRGQRGPTATVGDMAARVASDLDYIGSASLGLDVKILLLSAHKIFGDRAAF